MFIHKHAPVIIVQVKHFSACPQSPASELSVQLYETKMEVGVQGWINHYSLHSRFLICSAGGKLCDKREMSNVRVISTKLHCISNEFGFCCGT